MSGMLRSLAARGVLMLALSGVVSGCTSRTTNIGDRSGRTGPQIDSTIVAPSTHEAMLRNPGDLTIVRLGILQGYISRYWEQHQRIPAILGELNSVEPAGFARARKDGWGREIRYRQILPLHELRSAGADGEFDTGDDVVITGHRGRARPCAILDGTGRRFDFASDPPPCPEIGS